eukprot:gene10702-3324_t
MLLEKYDEGKKHLNTSIKLSKTCLSNYSYLLIAPQYDLEDLKNIETQFDAAIKECKSVETDQKEIGEFYSLLGASIALKIKSLTDENIVKVIKKLEQSLNYLETNVTLLLLGRLKLVQFLMKKSESLIDAREIFDRIDKNEDGFDILQFQYYIILIIMDIIEQKDIYQDKKWNFLMKKKK